MGERARDPHGRCRTAQEVGRRWSPISHGDLVEGPCSRTHARVTVRPRGSPAQQSRAEQAAGEGAERDGAAVPERHERDRVVHAVKGVSHRADPPGGQPGERACPHEVGRGGEPAHRGGQAAETFPPSSQPSQPSGIGTCIAAPASPPQARTPSCARPRRHTAQTRPRRRGSGTTRRRNGTGARTSGPAYQATARIDRACIGRATGLPRMVKPDVPSKGHRAGSPRCNEASAASELGSMDWMAPAVARGIAAGWPSGRYGRHDPGARRSRSGPPKDKRRPGTLAAG